MVQGARPLFFMDYISTGKLDPAHINEVMDGFIAGCKENGVALLGGETAEMPGLYPKGEYDLVGTIIGTVARRKLITGESIRPGDMIIGLPSTGLHTNGYSLARKVIFKTAGLGINDTFPGTKNTVADVLLAVHRSYLKPVTALMAEVQIQGMAHITGGGLYDNVPRVLPDQCRAMIDSTSWTVPAYYRFIEEKGKVDRHEMYRVFNMGIGYVIIVRPAALDQSLSILKAKKAGARVIGYIDEGPKCVEMMM
jgi:phosphoribosylformylglycinamidine cyclo-ligase